MARHGRSRSCLSCTSLAMRLTKIARLSSVGARGGFHFWLGAGLPIESGVGIGMAIGGKGGALFGGSVGGMEDRGGEDGSDGAGERGGSRFED